MTEKWKFFNASELIEKSKRPRVVIERYFRINPLGKIHWFDHKQVRWRDYPIHTKDDEPYFITIIGSAGGNIVKLIIPVKNIVNHYFGS